MCEVAVEEKTEFLLSELEGSARERAMDKLREWNTGDDWFTYTRECWANEKLPQEWAISDVDPEQMWFDLGRGQNLALTGGNVVLDSVMKLKPEWFTNLARKTACEKGWIYDPNVNIYHEDTRGIEGLEWAISDDFTFEGTVFEGTSYDDFVEMADIDALRELLDEHVKEAAAAVLDALESEYDYLSSDEAIEEMAKSNEYKFDEEGEVL